MLNFAGGGSWLVVQCTGQRTSVCAGALVVRSFLDCVEKGQEACNVKSTNTKRELTIYLCSGGLLDLLCFLSTFHHVLVSRSLHDFEFFRFASSQKPI